MHTYIPGSSFFSRLAAPLKQQLNYLHETIFFCKTTEDPWSCGDISSDSSWNFGFVQNSLLTS